MQLTTPLVTFALAAGAFAQGIAYSPAGSRTTEGNENNTIPIWSDSATYQQIHDHENMDAALGGLPTTLLGLTLRKDGGGTSTIAGRTMTLQMTVNMTTVTSRSASSSFAANLGAGAVTVLPFGPVSFPNLVPTSLPNPPGIVIPWTTPFAYQPTPGVSFCWEWRHHSATSRADGALDAVNMNDAENRANEGVGCLTAGQNAPATIAQRRLNLLGLSYRNQLTRAAANTGAVFLLGGQRTTLQLPGQCAPVLTNPLVFLPGGTDGLGTWDLSLVTPDLRGTGRAEVFGQFVWLDPTLPIGLGVSDMSVAVTPLRGAYFMARYFAAPSNGGAGFENATNAMGSSIGYGLVVGFMTP